MYLVVALCLHRASSSQRPIWWYFQNLQHIVYHLHYSSWAQSIKIAALQLDVWKPGRQSSSLSSYFPYVILGNLGSLHFHGKLRHLFLLFLGVCVCVKRRGREERQRAQVPADAYTDDKYPWRWS